MTCQNIDTLARSRACSRIGKALGLIPSAKRGEGKDPVFTNAMVILERLKRKFDYTKRTLCFGATVLLPGSTICKRIEYIFWLQGLS